MDRLCIRRSEELVLSVYVEAWVLHTLRCRLTLWKGGSQLIELLNHECEFKGRDDVLSRAKYAIEFPLDLLKDHPGKFMLTLHYYAEKGCMHFASREFDIDVI